MTTNAQTEPAELAEGDLARLAATPRLFVASDFDGVLAPIVSDPEAARPLAASIDALGQLSDTPNTFVAVVSGRERRMLKELVPGFERFSLAGSHGAELDDSSPLSAEEQQLLGRITTSLQHLAETYPGLWVETKTLSTAVHFRRVESEAREAAVAAVDTLVSDWPAKVVSGKEVVEFTLASATKGDAVRTLAERCQATATVVLGDDVTDEDAFAVLGRQDAGIKVGPGPTAANFRVASPDAVSTLLNSLADLRRRLAP